MYNVPIVSSLIKTPYISNITLHLPVSNTGRHYKTLWSQQDKSLNSIIVTLVVIQFILISNSGLCTKEVASGVTTWSLQFSIQINASQQVLYIYFLYVLVLLCLYIILYVIISL